jgi:hypothetical protein
MSLKVKLKDELWTKAKQGDYSFDIKPLAEGEGFVWPERSLKMSIHPGWLKMMDQLSVGDVVTTHEGHVGVITKVFEITSLGMKKYEVLIGNKKEIFFSMSIKKIEEEK